MLLAVDIGNTNIVLGLYDSKGSLKKTFRITTDRKRKAAAYNKLVTPLLKAHTVSDIIMCSVVPQAVAEFKKFCRDYIGLAVFDVGANIDKLGMKILLENPKEVGADRVVNAIAYYHKYKKPGIVLDLGTATTFDVISNKGEYLGGMISPGVNLAVAALSAAAAKLPQIKVARPKKAIGRSTVQAMQAGIYYGYLGLIERSVQEIASELGKKPYTIATGGLARYFEASESIDAIEENLTLDGLFIINQKLRKQAK